MAVLVHVMEAIENDIECFWCRQIWELTQIEVNSSNGTIGRAAVQRVSVVRPGM